VGVVGPGTQAGLPGRRVWPGGHGKVGFVPLGLFKPGEPGLLPGRPGVVLPGVPGVVLPGMPGVVLPGIRGVVLGGTPGVVGLLGVWAAAGPARMRLVPRMASDDVHVMSSLL
jgi:hypothetical protein